MEYGLVSEISVNKHERGFGDKLEAKIFLTIDLDWCHEIVLCDTLELLEKFDASATFFCTDRPKSLDLIRGNPRAELGLHPNFRPLLEKSCPPEQTAASVLDELLELIPEARSVRSHSLISGSTISSLFASRGLTHESNIKLPPRGSPYSEPFINSAGLISCPYHWGDQADMGTPIAPVTERSYLMLNFHPIHIFLNSEPIERYEQSRAFHFEPEKLVQWRYAGRGTRDEFVSLLSNP